MDRADEAVVFYSSHALEIKRLPALGKEAVEAGFNSMGLSVCNKREELEAWLHERDFKNSIVLFMSSGNYEGIDIEALAKRITEAI
jgi:UDP-N-acetylmuramate: L-alanyl-gamma-D-glutamyl-meso-diaminopimelate ligase